VVAHSKIRVDSVADCVEHTCRVHAGRYGGWASATNAMRPTYQGITGLTAAA